ncbi:MAG: hypothetical protein HYV09_40880 [Deltaproteobacteria bacterium]|nr:hypothetical protein [Deltaproteobacteria bacterium]
MCAIAGEESLPDPQVGWQVAGVGDVGGEPISIMSFQERDRLLVLLEQLREDEGRFVDPALVLEALQRRAVGPSQRIEEIFADPKRAAGSLPLQMDREIGARIGHAQRRDGVAPALAIERDRASQRLVELAPLEELEQVLDVRGLTPPDELREPRREQEACDQRLQPRDDPIESAGTAWSARPHRQTTGAIARAAGRLPMAGALRTSSRRGRRDHREEPCGEDREPADGSWSGRFLTQRRQNRRALDGRCPNDAFEDLARGLRLGHGEVRRRRRITERLELDHAPILDVDPRRWVDRLGL